MPQRTVAAKKSMDEIGGQKIRRMRAREMEKDFQICMTGPVKKGLGKCAWCHL